jgi:hypothetical protein
MKVSKKKLKNNTWKIFHYTPKDASGGFGFKEFLPFEEFTDFLYDDYFTVEYEQFSKDAIVEDDLYGWMPKCNQTTYSIIPMVV